MDETSAISALLKIIEYFILFLFVVFLAYYFTKLIAKKTSNMTKNSNIKILDFITLSSNSKIAIVSIIDNIYILSINNNQVNVIDKLSKNDIDIDKFKIQKEQKSFNTYLEDILANTKKMKYKAFKSKVKQFNEPIKSTKDRQKDKE